MEVALTDADIERLARKLGVWWDGPYSPLGNMWTIGDALAAPGIELRIWLDDGPGRARSEPTPVDLLTAALLLSGDPKKRPWCLVELWVGFRGESTMSDEYAAMLRAARGEAC